MTPEPDLKTWAAADCDVACDHLTRQLYATDASLYQVVPRAVAFPRDARQARAIIRAAAAAGVPITPRGAGTGLTGGAIGDGLVVDFARYNRQITKLNAEKRMVRVGPGVVLDQLNAFLKPHGFRFGPDVATSSRATLGGMIANNSSGSHVPVYGVTADHVASLDIVLADGRIETVGQDREGLRPLGARMAQLVQDHAPQIVERMPPGLLKHWPGYGLDRLLRAPGNLSALLCGSEGTLAAVVSAELKIVPLPRRRALGLVFFASVVDAMQAAVALRDLQPAAVEHVDAMLLDQTRGHPAFQTVRDLLELDAQPCESALIVEFFDDVEDRLAALTAKRWGLRSKILAAPAEMDAVWALRKTGLSLLTSCRGRAKPVEGIEDTAVRPHQLPEYVAGLQAILARRGLRASFYGHAAAGLLHVRPVLDLHEPAGLRAYRAVTAEVSALVRQFRGSFAAEHGLGMARTEFLGEHVGPELLAVMRAIKAAFDPANLFNPGKIVGDGRFRLDTHLRWTPGREIPLPFAPVLAFARRDHSFLANLEQCNGCGGCRKETPTMCPTFRSTGEEIMSPRGRANTIRALLEPDRLGDGDPLRSVEMEAALSHCLSCKACAAECPSNVDLALLKAELLHARIRRDGPNLRERLLSSVDGLGRLGCAAPELANAALAWPWLRGWMARTIGITARRPLPRYADQRFDAWFARRPPPSGTALPAKRRGRVILWDDTFVRYHEPHIGRAAVRVLEAAGFEVVLPTGRKCCGRPAFSQGNLDEASRLGRHNLRLLSTVDGERRPPAPILFLEPSCWSMFAEDYRELGLPGAEAVAGRCFLFEEFLDERLRREPEALCFVPRDERVAIHAHCHAKSLRPPAFLARLARRLPGRQVTLLDTGCCGMAGAFGALEAQYDLSLKVAAPLVERITSQPPGAMIVASGTSCRHQIEHLTPARPRHMAEVLAAALA